MNENMKVISKGPVKLQYFIPFRFDENLFDEVNQSFRSASGDGDPLWQEVLFPFFPSGINYIFSHVTDLMNVKESENSVCRSWKLAQPEGGRYIFNNNKDREVRFSFAGIHAHLFRTGVGLLSYQAVFEAGQELTAGMLIGFQSKMKMIGTECSQICRQQDVSENYAAGKKDKLFLGRMAAGLLRQRTCPRLQFFETMGNPNVPSIAILFSYLCYESPKPEGQETADEQQEILDLQEVTVHMAMGYSLSNVLAREVIRSSGQLANKVYYYISPNGCAVSVSPSPLNSRFFYDRPPEATYNFIFLITLYQHYSLLNFTMRISSDFASDTQSYLQNSGYADKMRDYITDIDTFLMKNDFATVSLTQYHNRFYTASREALNIEADKKSIRSGFESLINILQSMRQGEESRRWREQQEALEKERNEQNKRWHEQEEEFNRQKEEQRQKWHDQQEKQEEQDRRIAVIATVLAVLALFPELGGFISRVYQWIVKGCSSLGVEDFISMGVFLAAGIGMMVLLIMLWRTTSSEQ